MSGWALGLAFLLDLIVGDPSGWPHPVRFIGWLIDRLAGLGRRLAGRPALQKLAGVGIVAVTVGTTWLTCYLLLYLADRISPVLGLGLSVVLAYMTLAARSLYRETWRVVLALKEGDLVRARQLLGYVVGRDTRSLDRAGILRALVETIGENLSDGVIAPLFYLALGGPALGMAYKAVNTLDSMIGYKDERFKDLGWAAARLDDLANLIPARISAGLIVLAAVVLGLDARQSLKTWLREGGRHTSPNAGRPEAALAGALGVQLGGANVYHGKLVVKPTIGAASVPLSDRAVLKAEEVMLASSALMLMAAMLCRGVL